MNTFFATDEHGCSRITSNEFNSLETVILSPSLVILSETKDLYVTQDKLHEESLD